MIRREFNQKPSALFSKVIELLREGDNEILEKNEPHSLLVKHGTFWSWKPRDDSLKLLITLKPQEDKSVLFIHPYWSKEMILSNVLAYTAFSILVGFSLGIFFFSSILGVINTTTSILGIGAILLAFALLTLYVGWWYSHIEDYPKQFLKKLEQQN